ncbi:hypothetical protein BC940DRAFT_279576 [Gongronella butleri]|nr:hypothetical protein BC940DRAFT_279576 [Gongronella butleri]
MMNTIEVYGRTKAIDVHREHFGVVKGHMIKTSLPPPTPIRYPDVWPTTLATADGPKLIIGTQAMNALVASSMRLDRREAPSVGASTHSFTLEAHADALATRIFIDKESMDQATILANDASATAISDTHYLGQLRQLNSKYDSMATFFLARASGPITKAHVCQPYSLFTLHDYDKSRSSNAALFSYLGSAVITLGKDAKLARDDVVDCHDSSTGKANKIMAGILGLFDDNTHHIPIIKNAALNKLLEELAPLLHPSLAAANKTVEIAIAAAFSSN